MPGRVLYCNVGNAADGARGCEALSRYIWTALPWEFFLAFSRQLFLTRAEVVRDWSLGAEGVCQSRAHGVDGGHLLIFMYGEYCLSSSCSPPPARPSTALPRRTGASASRADYFTKCHAASRKEECGLTRRDFWGGGPGNG